MKANFGIKLSVFIHIFIQFAPTFSLPVTSETAATKLPKLESSTNENISKLPPFIFPEDSTTYNIVQNVTALKILQSRYKDEEDSTTVMNQFSSSTKANNVVPTRDPLTLNEATTPKIDDGKMKVKEKAKDNDADGESDYYDDDEDNDTSEDVEDVQASDDNDNTVLELEEQFHQRKNFPQVLDDDTIIEVPPTLKHGHWIAIFVGLLVFSSFIVYIGLILWRNVLEKRYGMRDRLVHDNENECYINSNSDMRYFRI